ncbi:hypothetical protein OAN24_03000 [Pseudodesulfovibrio sp.]|nr:hypothetical protein [Pseudodesulfovibrio sp.]
MLKKTAILTFSILAVGVFLIACSGEATEPAKSTVPASDLISGKPHELPIERMVTMVDIGAHSCIPWIALGFSWTPNWAGSYAQFGVQENPSAIQYECVNPSLIYAF